MIADAARTRFVVVTCTGALPAAETLRLLDRLGALGISAPVVIVNAVGAGTCSRCVAEREIERTQILDFARVLRKKRTGVREVLLAPAEPPPPHGLAALAAWRHTWRQLADA